MHHCPIVCAFVCAVEMLGEIISTLHMHRCKRSGQGQYLPLCMFQGQRYPLNSTTECTSAGIPTLASQEKKLVLSECTQDAQLLQR